jgi:hypothetical protein
MEGRGQSGFKSLAYYNKGRKGKPNKRSILHFKKCKNLSTRFILVFRGDYLPKVNAQSGSQQQHQPQKEKPSIRNPSL